MKKLLLALFILALFCGPAMAVTPIYGGSSGLGEIKTVVLLNNTDATITSATAISTSYVIPGKVKILGVDVVDMSSMNDTSTTPELFFALSDSTANGDFDTYLLNETEYDNTAPGYKEFPLNGFRLSRGLQVRQGAWTCVTIYYIQDRP